ncbi:hypothetical protein SARC_07743 [Sphaeroforma arctica JP610]|uniref:LTD domain-containing protein n=1 Tax=Sphaeroforma arctica JP610 TaxID=667725 RepID=A0A0L0FT53_9EUKA|nr:hypothetical protein SARC_07743 [Sphaeroforma arctica JP610]KNC79874.1 hypothetical protein SARC_07743 [Sphaeroforma arctica JP610]|eukprot:XP_014153776.1 hypothetical protein SARC_07743 [Sphaeroforma arctica JP610]
MRLSCAFASALAMGALPLGYSQTIVQDTTPSATLNETTEQITQNTTVVVAPAVDISTEMTAPNTTVAPSVNATQPNTVSAPSIDTNVTQPNTVSAPSIDTNVTQPNTVSTPSIDTTSVLYISEVQTTNMDWVELFNEGNTSINLAGYTLVHDRETDEAYTFRGDCGIIEANAYLMLVKDEVTNAEYANGDCMIPYGIKSSGELALYDSNNTLLDVTSWANVAYVSGHSWARKSGRAEIGMAEWEATSSNTWRRPNIFTKEITIPNIVDYSGGLHDRSVAYIQDPPQGSMTNVHLRVYTSSDKCVCDKYPEAHNNELCTCTWDDIINDDSGTDLWVPTMPCSVSIDVDGVKEYGYTANGEPTSEDNCVVHQRGGFTRSAKLKSYTVKIDKTFVPREWRGNKRLTMVKHPWTFSRTEVPLFAQQFRDMNDFHSLKTIIANVTVTYVDPETMEVVGEENMGGYTVFENSDEDMLDRHGLSSQTITGDRKESHLYKLRDFDWSYKSIFDEIVPFADETNEEQIFEYESLIENKDSDDNTKLVQTIYELNGKIPNMTFVEAVQKRFDMNNLAQWMAVNLICGDIDHMGKNAFIYSSNDTETWYYTPWDYDACFKPVMDHGPPSLSPYRYQDDHLFQGIMHYPELRDVFYPLLKKKIEYVRTETGFNRDALWDAAFEFANWTDPFCVKGQVDRDTLGTNTWNEGSELDLTFDPEFTDWDMSPRDLLFSQHDFIQDNLDIYVGLDYPPNLYNDISIRASSTDEDDKEEVFDVKALPFTSPIGNPLEITWQVYTGRPESLEDEVADGNIGLFDSRYFDPEIQDVEIVYEKTVNNEEERNYTDLSHTLLHGITIPCDEVRECEGEQCWITVYTTDTVTGIRSAAAHTDSQTELDYDDFC